MRSILGHRNILPQAIITILIFIIWGILVNSNPLFILLIGIWLCMMFDAYSQLSQRILLFAFGTTFFVFLIGREFLEQYRLHEPEIIFKEEVDNHTFTVFILALISFWISFRFFTKNHKIQPPKLNTLQLYYTERIRYYSKLIFYITLPIAFYFTLYAIYLVIRYGYLALYMERGELTSNNALITLFSKITIMTLPAFCIYLSTFPTKSDFKKILKWYILYIFLSLGEGQRGEFILGFMLLGFFYIYMQNIRPQEKWFTKKMMKYCVLSLPLIMVLSVLMNVARFGGQLDKIKISDSLTEFLYQQGVSSMIEKRTYESRRLIPEPISGYYTLEFLYTGLPARILGNQVYNGNNADHALKGNSFTHAFAYTMMKPVYLIGRGTGSSYVAELDYDFGYVGVILGSILYAYIFSLLGKTSNYNIFKRSVAFIVITRLLWAPRAAFTSFIMLLLSPSIIFLLIFVFGMAYLKRPIIENNFNSFTERKHEIQNW